MATTTATATVSAPKVTPSSACGVRLFDTPVHDAVCAMPSSGNYTDVMAACCQNADVVSYYDGCGLYCLAAGQTVAELTACLFDRGAAYSDVFCRGEVNATATGAATGAVLPSDASASVVFTNGNTRPTGSSSSSNTDDSSPDSSDSPAAAPVLRPDFAGVSTLGLTIGALLFSATAFGAFQL
ncbi:hypothetical protein GGS23DRAFT_590297 [Durotheca rogersii]|uniref:uncharacterized protein n=1 Tax=Durotheca rogersii TaxID=419775 RepID=UPI00221E4D62|nr:uncharacterized protein GGS23DRAFT_590297 [Durotheca rogersii]KAI5855041.1 hypothetical protein GGS23DRAFT_590297 [Durotheca rogersii]